ncbi:MAG: hypothetical protein O7D94_06815, partial [Planctomycetota bacterium]|nr:hypothetical protein [Planctomycetota bacterium]
MRFGLFRRRVIRMDQYDLTNANILCRFDHKRLYVAPSGGPGEQFSVSVREIDEPIRFVQCVFSAALYQGKPGKLPDDELVR